MKSETFTVPLTEQHYQVMTADGTIIRVRLHPGANRLEISYHPGVVRRYPTSEEEPEAERLDLNKRIRRLEELRIADDNRLVWVENRVWRVKDLERQVAGLRSMQPANENGRLVFRTPDGTRYVNAAGNFIELEPPRPP